MTSIGPRSDMIITKIERTEVDKRLTAMGKSAPFYSKDFDKDFQLVEITAPNKLSDDERDLIVIVAVKTLLYKSGGTTDRWSKEFFEQVETLKTKKISFISHAHRLSENKSFEIPGLFQYYSGSGTITPFESAT